MQLGLALPDLIRHVVRGDGEPRHIPGDRVFTVDHVMFCHRSLEVSDASYNFKMKYQPPTASPPPKKNRTRTRQIVWFNPPFSLNVETNIGKEFFQIIDKFPKINILAPIINRSKVKMSYRTMKNMNQVVSSHNKITLADDEPVQPVCNCQRSKKHLCPLPGQCTVDANGPVESVVYRAEIERTDTGGV